MEYTKFLEEKEKKIAVLFKKYEEDINIRFKEHINTIFYYQEESLLITIPNDEVKDSVVLVKELCKHISECLHINYGWPKDYFTFNVKSCCIDRYKGSTQECGIHHKMYSLPCKDKFYAIYFRRNE